MLHDPAGSDRPVILDPDSPDVTTIEVAGRRWALLAPDDGGVGGLGGGLKWGVALGGVLITALVIVAMIAADRAERANKTKSQFLSRMSHELRTPLNAVIGFAQVIQMEDAPPETAAQAAHIEGAGRHLLTLIDDVLQISRIEALEFRFSFEPVRAGDVVDEVAQLLAPQARSAGVTLDHSRRDFDTRIEVDRQRLVQVLLNLGSNAIKYNRAGGHVEIGTRRLSPRTLRILVRDTGIGIPADQHKRLFVPFERLGAEATGVEGNGLGLSLCKGLATAMGGEIGFQSAAGAGSTFWVDFEVVDTPAPTAPDAPSDIVAGVPPTSGDRTTGDGVVLCVEDNEANLALVTDALGPVDGVTLLVARTGAEAMAVLSATRVDLLLLDVDLPDIDGATLLERARATTTRPLPAVVLSADATTATVHRLEKAGADEYLTKPVDIAHLIETVHRHLGVHDAEPATTGAHP
jgi:signal transduction histidine kinase/CheY-like chemotaxis protein